MTYGELIDSFLVFEQQNRMFELRVNDILVWQYIRLYIFNSLSEFFQFEIMEKYSTLRDKPYKIPITQKIYANTLGNQYHVKKKDIIIIPDRRLFPYKNKFRDIYTDFFPQILKNNFYTLYFGDSNGNHHLFKGKNIIYADMFDFAKKNNIETYVFPRINKSEFIKNIVDPIQSYWNIRLNKNVFYGWMGALYLRCSIRDLNYKYYKEILDNISPKVVIITNSYNPFKMQLCEVCKKKNVLVIEMQHGRCDRFHLAYNYPSNTGKAGFPDYFFSFGEIERECRFPIDQSHVIPVGYPELEMHIKPSVHKKKTVLFVSDGLMGMEKYALEFAALSKGRYKILYKLHPFEVSNGKSTINAMFYGSNIEVIDSMNTTLHDCLNVSDWVVGRNSTGLIEATMFPVKIAVLKSASYEAMSNIYENNYGVLVEDAHELFDVIKLDKPCNRADNIFFKKNALSNIEKSLYKIIGSRT